MRVQLSDTVQREIELAVRTQASQSLVVDVYATAEEIQRRLGGDSDDIDAIAATLTQLAAQCGCAVELGHHGGGAAHSA